LETRSNGEPLVRRADLIEHLRAARDGDMYFDEEDVARLTLTVAEMGARVHAEPTRFAIEGLGWFECVRFASPATGRPFIADGKLDAEPLSSHWRSCVRTVHFPDAPKERTAIIADLFDTLCIDTEETVSLSADPPARWELLRLDDNANTFHVAWFTGYAKARARLAQFEAGMHKQSYWLERR
jgi:hypothetical protein